MAPIERYVVESVKNIPTSLDFEIWNNTYNPDFIDINLKSRVPEKWMNIYYVLEDPEYCNSPIKPINGYAKNFGIVPELVSIINGVVTLRQANHAEIFLLVKDGTLSTMDRPWVRQYYKSSEPLVRPLECFGDQYAFYMPWKVDSDLEIEITSCKDSPVYVFNKTINNKKVDASLRYVNSPLIPFYFKSSGAHMVNPEYGRIKVGSPLFNISFKANKELEEKIKAFYGKKN